MECLVAIIQRLHEALSALGDASVRLPAVVAVGSQSSGKSSVLESIVGRDFLPRGAGIVTRRPVLMYLHNIQSGPRTQDGLEPEGGGPQEATEWVEMQHRPGHKWYSFEEVKQELVREMDRGAGRNKGISPEPICLTIHSPRVPDLVIIDLPGITKVPVGDQPPDIEMQIRRLCLHYLSQQNNIILAVTPANQDVTNSDALKLALEADPEGERTIGVLTKIDLMDPGTDARDVLAGRVVPLRRGFVPIVCRSQKDISEAVSIATGSARERTFFTRHYAYKHMAARCGTPYLTRVLSHMLFTAIRAHLPALRSQLSLTAQSYEAQLRELGDPVDAAGPKEQGHLLLKLLSRFAANFCDMIEGRVHADAGGDLLIDELFGGARMQEIVRTRFNQWTAEWEVLMDSQLRDEEILMALRNSAGPRTALFIPEQAFASLVRRQIVQLKDLGRRFADEIYDELRRIGEKCEPPQLYRFGELREKAVEVVQAVLRRAFVPTVDMIDRLIDIELSHINTQHPDFIGASRALALAEERGWVMRGEEGGSAGSDPTRPGEEGGSSGSGSSGASGDVAWAMRHLGVQPAQRGAFTALPRSPAPASSRGGAAAASASAAAAAAASGVNGDDIRVRFNERVAKEVLGGDDVGMWGGVVRALRRVGGPNSPFVGIPRAGPGAGKGGGGGAGGSSSSSTAGLYSPMQAMSGAAAAAAAGGRLAAGKGSPAGYQQQQQQQQHSHHLFPTGLVGGQEGKGSAAGGSSGEGSSGGSGSGYQGEALLVVPQRPLPETITPADLRADDKERQEIVLLRILLNSYLHIVKKNYTDFVPKTVMCMLVNRVKDEIASELVHNLYAQITSLETLLRETDDVASRRRELMEQLAVLNRGIGILNEIRDTGILSAPPTGGASSGSGGSGEGLLQGAAGYAGGGGEGRSSAASSTASSAAAFSGGYSSSAPMGSSPGPEEVGGGRGQQYQQQQQQHIKGGGGGRKSLGEQPSSSYSLPSQAPPRLGSLSV